MSLCIVCHKKVATIPDRYSGSSRKKLCPECHAERLKDDLRYIIAVETKRKQEEGK
jgi:hypothetical protein